MKHHLAYMLPVLLAACLPDGENGQGGGPDARPSMSEAEIAVCEAEGGMAGIAGLLGGQYCFPRASDAGKACTRAADCEGFCLSETRTCQEILYPYGCQSFLNDAGAVEQICFD